MGRSGGLASSELLSDFPPVVVEAEEEAAIRMQSVNLPSLQVRGSYSIAPPRDFQVAPGLGEGMSGVEPYLRGLWGVRAIDIACKPVPWCTSAKLKLVLYLWITCA